MRLHDADWAPSPRRVRIYLAEKGIAVERRIVDLRGGEMLSDAYRIENPFGAVPVLELDDGELIPESAAICRYFETLHPAPPLFGGDDPLAVARIESWMRRIEQDGYAAAVNVLRNTRSAFTDRPLPGAWPPMLQLPALAERLAPGGRIIAIVPKTSGSTMAARISGTGDDLSVRPLFDAQAPVIAEFRRAPAFAL